MYESGGVKVLVSRDREKERVGERESESVVRMCRMSRKVRERKGSRIVNRGDVTGQNMMMTRMSESNDSLSVCVV